MKSSDLFIKILENKWVETIYWVPWEENLDILESIRKSKIELVLTHNEQTAVFMAATYGRFTWKAGVAMATLWPWATNMMTWVAYASLWWMPVILLTWQKPQNKSKQWQFQIVDVVSMMKPISKYATSIVSWVRIPYILENAFRIAEEEKPWPVCLEIPEDIAGENIEKGSCVVDLNISKHRRPVLDEKWMKNLISELEKAKSPIILVWSWANRKRITKYLSAFIDKYDIPFFTSQMWKWVVDERKSQFIWTAALTSWDYVHDCIKKSDLIISVWYDIVEKPTKVLWVNWIKVININFFPSSYDYVYSPYLDVVWDIANVFWRLSIAEINSENWDFSEIYKINEKNKIQLEKNLSLEENFSFMMPRKFCKDLRESLWEDDILTLDNGLYKVWMARNYPAYKPNTVLLDNALATMWAWYASAIEAKRINPDKKVVCVTWDWWLMMNLWDIETAVRLKIDLVIIILNNSSYWMIKWKQKNAWFDDFWLDFWNTNYVNLAKSFWAKWYKVEKKEDFKAVLENALNEKWINIIDLDFDYPEDWKIL